VTRYIEAPTAYEREPGDGPVVFVAGGISGSDDWQHDVALPRLLASPLPLVVLGPRRVDFPMDDQLAYEEQVRWEATHLHLGADTVIMMWFPDSRVEHPIAWFEFGMAIAGTRHLVVGCHPNYCRAKDVRLQFRQYRRDARLYESLEETVDATLDLASQLRVTA
jgi:hypothetical protein